jgi:hypothetical protein
LAEDFFDWARRVEENRRAIRVMGIKSDTKRFSGRINFMVYLSWSDFLL